MLPNLFYEANIITLLPKPNKGSIKQINKQQMYRPIFLMNIRHKNPQQNISKPIPTKCWKIIHHDQKLYTWELIQVYRV